MLTITVTPSDHVDNMNGILLKLVIMAGPPYIYTYIAKYDETRLFIEINMGPIQ